MEHRSRLASSWGADHSTLALVLAGGHGKRLRGLTEWRAKPAVPFGGHYRTVDFTLSNCLNSGIRRVALLTQYKSQSLIRHIHHSWGFLRRELDEFIEIWPAQQRLGERWYSGTVDAVHQNRDLIEALDPEVVLVLAGDHVYSMDYSRLLEQHAAKRADLTVACVEVPIGDGSNFGIVGADRDGRVRSFVEKPEHPSPAPGKYEVALASMGVYVFDRSFLFECMDRDAADDRSTHDFGYSLLPSALESARVFAHDFRDARNPALPGYWRDVGTVESYWQAHMDLLDEPPKLDLYDESWPIRTERSVQPPARIAGRVRVSSAILAPGCVVCGDVYRSVVSTGASIGGHSRVSESVLLPGCSIGKNCVIDRVIVDSGCEIPDNTVIGSTVVGDSEGAYFLSPSGVVLVPRGRVVPHRRMAAARMVA
ncbi:MAG TPA: glucose-1-phosphate adenylyltransferase [Gammaproteobacteria bacterium]|nr:glucose-1-phosphate adenylyltransferase [Gammaproteobacteria bacterium]